MNENKPVAIQITAFTFAELLVLLAILSVMATIALPYASHSNRQLQWQQEIANLKTSLALLIEQAKTTQRPTRLTIDPVEQSYQLQQTSNRADEDFEPLPGALGQKRLLEKHSSFDQLEGFQNDGQNKILLFDPSRPWPRAELTILTEQSIHHLLINGQTIEYQHEN